MLPSEESWKKKLKDILKVIVEILSFILLTIKLETRGIRAPEIATNKEYFSRKDVTDPNNLPYLHRNPAI